MIAKDTMEMSQAEDEQTTISDDRKSTIAIVQLTRFGDVVQTAHAVREFRNEYPAIRLILIARKRFAAPLRWLLDTLFDQCYFLDFHQMMDSTSNKELSLDEICNKLHGFVSRINSEDINVLLNLSFSKSSGLLCGLINAKNKLGMNNDPQSLELRISDHWSQFVYSSVMRGPLSPFSLVDIYRRMMGGFKPVATTSVRPKIDYNQQKISIAIHPFASDPKKRWDGKKWVEIIYQLLKIHPNLEITIVGSRDEQLAGEEIINAPLIDNYSHRISNMAGETTIKELFELIAASDLFLGHDSMVSHVAAYQQCPTITIALGTVRPHETAPFGINNYVLAPKTKCFPCFPKDSCPLYKCHADIPFQIVHSVVDTYLKHGEINRKFLEEKSSSFHLDAVKCYQSKFMDTGMYQLIDTLRNDLSLTDFFRLLYRISWLYFFTSEEETHDIPPLGADVAKQLPHYRKGLQQLFELCEFGKKYSQYILEEISSQTPNLINIKTHSAKIDEIDSLVKVLHQCYPHLAPLLDYLAVQKGNLQGSNIVELTESTYFVYSDCSAVSSLMYDLVLKSENKVTGKRSISQPEV
ncbi:MAG: glycosyltransferase family 9 protein [Bdellovibrionales bacterium]|jgi:ADP-heptose:LPS heptosyltransferase|nr:glycosyltransferase family 9 protein [Bdellovibrionales bacterium]MBT3526069.1 glycosyltransferase family 9 protein [Bdellovibrionales bacterium]MBT7669987.1 glycosyltransferase family 9 protein [Bdellovibrionales bacterium]MBT7768080.1 glycosyltransferase family 9 protein [Bdellovibrionales bacterium]